MAMTATAVDVAGLTDRMPIYSKMIAALVAVAVCEGEAEGIMTAPPVNTQD